MSAFISGTPVVVTSRGPGKLFLLSYDSNGGLPGHVGFIETTREGTTRFIISHSYTFRKFAFYFEGKGGAVWNIGSSLQRQPVGNSWTDARVATYGGTTVTTADVTASLNGAVQRNNEVTAFIVPDLI